MKDKILYVPIDLVGSDAKAKIFESDLVLSLIRAQIEIEQKGLPITLGLKTTVVRPTPHNFGVSDEGRNSFDNGLRILREAGISYTWVDTYPSGPTRSMYGVLFDSGVIASGFSATATSDLDQFPPDQNLEKVLELHETVRSHNILLGSGSRNVPVVLAYNEANKNLRRIMEGIFNIAIRKAAENSGKEMINTTNTENASSDPAYVRHDDFITGAYVFNINHQKAFKFISNLSRTARKHNFFGFEGEYLMTIMSASIGGIASLYFNSCQNPFEPIDQKVERERIIEKQIKAPLEKLKHTDARKFILQALEDTKDLTRFYPIEIIQEVTGIMLKTIHS